MEERSMGWGRERTVVGTRSFEHAGMGEKSLLSIPEAVRHGKRLRRRRKRGMRNPNLVMIGNCRNPRCCYSVRSGSLHWVELWTLLHELEGNERKSCLISNYHVFLLEIFFIPFYFYKCVGILNNYLSVFSYVFILLKYI